MTYILFDRMQIFYQALPVIEAFRSGEHHIRLDPLVDIIEGTVSDLFLFIEIFNGKESRKLNLQSLSIPPSEPPRFSGN